MDMAPAPAPLQQALESLRLDGAIYFRAELSESWCYQTLSAELTALLRPGAKRLLVFHIIAKGRCWVRVGDGERHWADEGDVLVLPYGDQHVVGGETDAEPVAIDTLLDPPPWATMPVLEYGGGGDRCDIVCGYLHSDDPLFDPAMAAFPNIFVVTPPPGPATAFVHASIDWALATRSSYEPETQMSTRLPELLLIEVLRLHLATAPATDRGWVAALRDPVLAPALALLHAEPATRWTVADLAARCAVSRSVLDQRFRLVLGRPPIRYLTEWRMHLATDLLATTDLTIFEIARRVGYDAEESFSRAFKRATGVPPSERRR
jgi:AraC-like DNA-binding protein